ncbi:HNH endonuclease family protein [Actinokineospora guangxiensis]|uniref:HNH endonuclease family protein n=1 Tax=Actinokineospora guangxiensis TaxID=1490288 RepID=A0ABW0EQR7_9PSEU
MVQLLERDGSRRRAAKRPVTWGSVVVGILLALLAWWLASRETAEIDGAVTDAEVADAVAALRVIPVRAEDTGNPYRRADWPHWTSDGTGCDTRERALRDQGRDVATGAGCRPTGGAWTSPYDGVEITDPSEADLDHVVPLAEANRSGARSWTREQRTAFANDPDQLLVVSASSNRSKGDQDPSRWMPDARYSCAYAVRWVTTKHRYELSVDTAEKQVLTGVLARCPR